MRQGWQETLLRGLLLLLLLLGSRSSVASDSGNKDKNLFGDKCTVDGDCEFVGAVCEVHGNGNGKCQCGPDVPVTNHIDKCGEAVAVNKSCFFNEQCEAQTPETECKDDICKCRFEKEPSTKPDGSVECIVVQNAYYPKKYVDPAMIGILVAMFLMFITICVVLRLFSRARWRENRTIFNTPNPRLMNVSLLRENKLLHTDRRGSRSSARGPSRQPSMASLRAHSPNSQGRLFLGSRRGSRGSSNASATSNRSNKSPPQAANLSSATTPMLESVTVEVQEPKA
ncbi:uncharacterized protein jus isoform X1 [Tribolium castaneum]|uniref:EB domain-containing protein n=1 Tax=Tribolium castaneum TaxID=7070 RepID=D6W8Z5_TRICA|nr:PREDICTED: uncharacterized protein LOC664170 isoform X1 [Tribolium castaneum]EEZ98417.2 hypothetical protein TcasGA2_TC000885 [Tribolium castaneum]|eukprot:XP_975276.2 PREDICTED: uncharacterized protein LOC664170 isoform X1 [Tribolium castaneum]